MFIRKTSSALFAAALVTAVGFAAIPTANADRGDQAQMVRKGRFVWHVPAVSGEKATTQSPRAKDRTGVVYDKGSAGTYVRHTRTVNKISSPTPRAVTKKTDYDATRRRVVDHGKHKHFLP